MKNSSLESRLYSIPSNLDQKGLENLRKKSESPSKTFNSTMTEQLIEPPARVWDKIEKILDEQDYRRNNANSIIASSFSNKPNYNRSKFYLASVAGLGLVAGLIWIIR
jgi:hypothetical protein